jgi:hypothetical protein
MAIRNYLFILTGCFVLILQAGDSQLCAQIFTSGDDEKPKQWWLSAGLGAGPRGLALGIGYMKQTRKSAFSLRFAGMQELGDIIFDTSDQPKESDWDVGILYGIHWNSEVAISAGLSVIGGVRRGKFLYEEEGFFSSAVYERLKYQTLGIPIEVQLMAPPVKRFGFGITGLVNFNSHDTFYAVLLNILIAPSN